MNGEIVGVETADAIPLDGILQEPTGSGSLPVDVMILHHGVGNNFYHHPMFSDLSVHLRAAGCAALCVNSRGHDTVYNVTTRHGLKRLGAAYEVVDDCRHDWDAWIGFAATRGYRRIGLWGHSLGAVKTIYYLAVQPDPRVVCAVASSPPRQSYENYLTQPEKDRTQFSSEYALAKKAIDEGEPSRLVETRYRRQTVFSAQTFADKYGPGSRYDVFKHIPQVTVPLLVTWGGLEPQDSNPGRVGFYELPEAAPGLAKENPHAAFVEIPGADHPYTGKRAELWTEVEGWLQRLGS